MPRLIDNLILVVDDDEMVRTLTATVLRTAGYAVALAGSGMEAFTTMEGFYFALVIMDLEMPGMSGIEATACIRKNADPRTASTPVIAYSSEHIDDREAFCKEHGFNFFVPKQDGTDAIRKVVHDFFASR